MIEPKPGQTTPVTPSSEIQAEIERLRKVAERYAIEDAKTEEEKGKEYERQQVLLKQREDLKAQIETINNELREMLGYDFVE